MSVKNKTIDRNKQKIHRSTQYLFLSTNTKFVGENDDDQAKKTFK